VVSFGSQVAGRAALRALRHPAFWIVVLLAVLGLFWIYR
jgi:hypothetical protein